MDPDPSVLEQALHVVRHIADKVEDVDMVFQELGEDALLDKLAGSLESENEDVLLQVGHCLSGLKALCNH